MDILGISAYYHDSAAVLVRDGAIVAAAQEERFTRKKHDARFPGHAIEYCLAEGGVRLGGLGRVVFYDKPLVKFDRLLETYIAFAPHGFKSFLTAMPIWLKEKLLSEVSSEKGAVPDRRVPPPRPPTPDVHRAPSVARRLCVFREPIRAGRRSVHGRGR